MAPALKPNQGKTKQPKAKATQLRKRKKLGNRRETSKRQKKAPASHDSDKRSPASDSSSASDSLSSDDEPRKPKHAKDEDTEATNRMIGVLGLLSYGTNKDTPPSVSHWNTPKNDHTLRKHFKIERRLVSTDDFVLGYFWGDGQFPHSYSRWLDYPEVKIILNFIEESTSPVNISETEVFLPAHIWSGDRRKGLCELINRKLHTVLRVPYRPQLENIGYMDATPTLQAM